MIKTVKKSLLYILCIAVLFAFAPMMTGVSDVAMAASDSKTVLLDKIEDWSGQYVLKSYYGDYDSDGTKEVFAVVGEDENNNEIWFASPNQIKNLTERTGFFGYYDETNKKVVKVSKKQKLFIMETGIHGSMSVSLCCYVKKGKVIIAKGGEKLQRLEHIKGKDFKTFLKACDGVKTDGMFSGYTAKAYYLKWTGKGFKEYKGKYISKKKFKKYKGAKTILKKIGKAKYKVHKIIKRSNNIININLSKKIEYGRQYENVTLKLKGKKVTLVKNGYYSNSKNIVEKSSYGGIYKKSVW